MTIRSPRYGRHLDDFTPGAVYPHPWEVTVDDGMLALFAASFQDAIPVYASRTAARAVGFTDRPVHPLLLLNLGLSFSVHDVSEQAIAHLAYIDVRFPAPAYPGDTLTASSRVLSAKAVSSGDKGVVHVATELVNERGDVVCAFERKALVRAGKVANRPADPAVAVEPIGPRDELPRAPAPILALAASGATGAAPRDAAKRVRPGFALTWDDLAVGDVFAHEVGRTVSDAEHMQLTTLVRNSHPLHFDEVYCAKNSFAKTRVVYGGLVLSWVLALTSRDVAGHAVWDLGLDEGAHPSGVLGGDTLYAATKVLALEPRGPGYGAATLRIVGVKNTTATSLLEKGADLFTPELGKTDGKVKEKVVEITRTLLLQRR